MNLSKIVQKLPPGLEDKSVEFYLFDNMIKCLHNGYRYLWSEIPSWIIEIVAKDMFQNKKAMKCLVEMKLKRREQKLRQYIICQFGGFDGEPDINDKGEINYTEYFDCGLRGSCPYEGKLCATIKVANGYLTKQELNVLKLVAIAKMNKEIAHMLNISEETVSTHNQNIQRKLGVDNKIDMASFAISKNII